MAAKIILEGDKNSLPPKQSKTAVLVIGRWQPPTIGHMKLIGAAKKAWRDFKYDAVVVCVVEGKETSKNKKQNPLSGKSRVLYLENSSQGAGVKFAIVGSAFDAFTKCREMGYEPMCVVGGSFDGNEENRAEGYKKLLDKYFVGPDGESIKHRAVVVPREKESDGVSGVSGSLVRAAVVADRFDDFKEMVSLNSDELVKQMYDELKAALVTKKKEQ